MHLIDSTDGWATLITTTNVVGGDRISTVGDSVTLTESSSSFTAKMTAGDAVGKYVLTVEPSDSPTGEVSVGLECEIIVTIGGQTKTLEGVYYYFDIVTDAIGTLDLTEITMTVGDIYGDYVASENIADPANYYWYAVGLPDGITMSEAGYISGVPLESGSFTAKVVAMVRNIDGNIGGNAIETITGDLSIEVSSATQEMDDYYFVVSINGTDQAKNIGSYVVVTGDNVVLKTYNKSDSPDDANSVMIVDEVGTVKQASKTGDSETGSYTIPTNGTGAYRVVITMGESGNTETAEFILYVSPSLDNVQAGIVITGN